MKILFPAVLTLTIAAVGTARADEPAGAPAAGAPTEATPPPMASGGGMAVDTAAGFGRLGQIAVSGELQFSILHDSQSMGGGSSTVVVIQPALDYLWLPTCRWVGRSVSRRGHRPLGPAPATSLRFHFSRGVVTTCT